MAVLTEKFINNLVTGNSFSQLLHWTLEIERILGKIQTTQAQALDARLQLNGRLAKKPDDQKLQIEKKALSDRLEALAMQKGELDYFQNQLVVTLQKPKHAQSLRLIGAHPIYEKDPALPAVQKKLAAPIKAIPRPASLDLRPKQRPKAGLRTVTQSAKSPPGMIRRVLKKFHRRGK